MDSIGDNVMAIICVVVGILIIGCALVPIVDNASVVETEETTITPTSGYNTFTEESVKWVGPLAEVVIEADGTSLTLNGENVTTPMTIYSAIGQSNQYLWFSTSANKFVVFPAFSGEAEEMTIKGTVTYSNGQISVTGTKADNTPYEQTMSAETLYINYADGYEGAADTAIYGLTSGSFNIGIGQMAVSQTGSTTVTIETETLPTGMTMTLSDDGSYATITPGSGKWWAPYEWTGTITTTETVTSDSEYKALYNIIPVLCILGMAYVLIRRFY